MHTIYMTQMPSNSPIPEWNVGDRLRKSLEHAGISVGAIADHFDVSRNTIGNYLSGRTSPNRRTMMLWALRTGVAIEWLETGIAPTDNGGGDGVLLPRLDSNQQPAGNTFALVRPLRPAA